MTIRNFTRIFIAITIGCLVPGCKMMQIAEIGPQTHFNYPNSNVKALGPVKVEADGPSGLMMTFRTGEMDQKLYNTAIAQVEGANIIVDYIRTTDVYYVPVLPIFWSKVKLEGTAAKMELGVQVIH